MEGLEALQSHQNHMLIGFLHTLRNLEGESVPPSSQKIFIGKRVILKNCHTKIIC